MSYRWERLPWKIALYAVVRWVVESIDPTLAEWTARNLWIHVFLAAACVMAVDAVWEWLTRRTNV